MFDELKNLNIDTHSDSELNALVRQTLPIAITFVRASQKLLTKDNPNRQACDNCDKAGICKEPCELVTSQLPGIYSGSSLLNKTFGGSLDNICDTITDHINDDDEAPKKLDRSSLRSIDRIRTDEIFILYKNCHLIFTTKEWRVVTLKIRDGNSYRSIGKKLGIAISTASDTFQRAKKKMEHYYKKQRKCGN